MKPLLMVHVDVDCLKTVARFFGVGVESDLNLVYDVAIPRFIELFKKYKILATFFVVGSVLNNKKNVNILRQVLQEGHEIANHTFSHPFGMASLSKERKSEEINKGHYIIKEKLDVEAKGFRAPGYDISEDILNIINNLGYLYDSSLYPSFLVPAIKIYSRVLRLGKNRGNTDKGYGKWVYGFGLTSPYHPSSSSLCRPGRMDIFEIPLSVMPFTRIPLHTTTLFNAPFKLVSLGNRLLLRKKIPYTLVMHGVDLLDFGKDCVPRGLSLCPSFKKSISDKLNMVEKLLKELLSVRKLTRTIDFVKQTH